MKGTPNEVCEHKKAKCTKAPKVIPKKPAIYPKIIYINLKILTENFREKLGIENPQIPVKATIIISIGLTIFAETAASPKIKAPIIPIVVLKEEDTLILAS